MSKLFCLYLNSCYVKRHILHIIVKLEMSTFQIWNRFYSTMQKQPIRITFTKVEIKFLVQWTTSFGSLVLLPNLWWSGTISNVDF